MKYDLHIHSTVSDGKVSRDEIIKQADIQMYNFKKSRKKNRK